MTLIKLTHANLNTPMYMASNLVAGFYHSDGHKCTHVVATGGAVFPAKETVVEIQRLLNSEGAKTPTPSGNGAASAQEEQT